MLEKRRYRVGLDLKQYIRRFIIGCFLSAALSGVAIAVVCVRTYTGIINDLKTQYETQHDAEIQQLTLTHDTEYAILLGELEDTQKNCKESLDLQEKMHDEYVAKLNTEIDSLEEMVDSYLITGQASFGALQKYWYVFKDSPSNSGLTLDAIQFADEQCKKYDINPDWVWHIYWCESNFTASVDNSSSGARGLGQVMPGTG